jgi:hypothetical protein
MNPALVRASLRIVSEGIPNSLCATTPNMIAVAIAAARAKIEITTRTIPAWQSHFSGRRTKRGGRSALDIHYDMVRRPDLAYRTFCDSLPRRFFFGAVTVVSTYDRVSPSHEHELSETETPDDLRG